MKETVTGVVAFVAMLFLAMFFASWVSAQNGGDAGSSLAEHNLAGELDQNLDRLNVNLKGTSATPTPAGTDRCVIRCDATADALAVSISGGAYENIAGTGVACQCAAAGANSTAVGVAAAATGAGSISIGAGNSTNDTNSVCIGALAGCDGDQSVQIGGATTASGTPSDSVCVGYFCQNLDLDSIAIGSQSTAYGDSIAIGAGAVSNATGQAVLGGVNAGVSELIIGKGPTATSPVAATIRPSAKSGTNGAGTALFLEGGRGTGTGVSSGIGFKIPLAGVSGTGSNSASLVWSIDGTGDFVSSIGSGNVDIKLKDADALVLGTGGDGQIYFNGTNLIIIPDAVGSGYLSVSGDARVVGEFRANGVASDGTGKVVCIKSDGNMGTCTTAVDSGGACTCS